MNPELLVQTRVDKFLITRYLQSGGMADVYEALDTMLNRPVAMKVLRAVLATEEAHRMRFHREAQAVAGLQHPHIIEIFNVGVMEDKRPYFTMPFLAGGTLAEQMQRLDDGGKVLAVPQILYLVRHVADALALAHAAGIVHRDLKPANIMLRSSLDPVVMDFGIAAISQQSMQLTQTGAFIGTFLYASPEQQMGQPVDGRSDIYSLGLIMFEMLCGRLPQVGELPENQLRLARPALSDYTINLVMQCIRYQPGDRYADAGALVQALDVALGGEAETRPAPSAPRSRWGQPWWVYLLVPLIIVLFGVGAFSLYLGGAPTPTPAPVPTAIFVQSVANEVATTAGNAAGVSTSTLAPPSTVVAPYTSTPTFTPMPTETAVPTHTPTSVPTPLPVPTAGIGAPYGRIIFTCFIDNIDQICTVNVDGSGYTQLTDEGATSFYSSFVPENNEVVFSSRREGMFLLYSMNSDGTNVARLGPTFLGSIFAPAVSPDGQQILFTAADGDSQNIWVMNRDGSNLRQLTDNLGDNVDGTWSPDGTQIAFASDRDEGFNHYIMNADGSDVRLLDVGVPAQGGRSDWSPDGRWLAFYAGPGDSRDIYLASVDGTVVHQLTDRGSNLAPAFSPDGNWIVFTSYLDGDAEIYIMRLDGTDVRQLTFNTYSDWQPRWQR